ncbi:hypothetical protein DT376_38230, partial [Pseudomonas aeruginosa]
HGLDLVQVVDQIVMFVGCGFQHDDSPVLSFAWVGFCDRQSTFRLVGHSGEAAPFLDGLLLTAALRRDNPGAAGRRSCILDRIRPVLPRRPRRSVLSSAHPRRYSVAPACGPVAEVIDVLASLVGAVPRPSRAGR